MAETNETIANIIAEMRALSNPISDGIIAINGRIIADRLEAAHRREAVTGSNQFSDAEKLREALSDACYAMFNFLKAQNGGYEEMANALDKAKAALAAPPRNCDRFGSSTQARAEWYKTEVLPRVEGVVSGVEPQFVDWLFAPATEKEGGNDADE